MLKSIKHAYLGHSHMGEPLPKLGKLLNYTCIRQALLVLLVI